MKRPHNRSGRQRWGISFQQPVTAVDSATSCAGTSDYMALCRALVLYVSGTQVPLSWRFIR